jgi:DNA-binding NarL/FixJ family response regulator
MMKILIADDHPIVRRGLKQILAEEPDLAIAGEARSSQEVMELVRKQDWNAVILDITMPGRGGLETLKEIKKERPKLPVLILSMHSEDQYGVRALKAGAAGYMTKESAPEKLVQALRKIIKGGKYISPTLAEKLVLDLERDTPNSPHETLSDREHQVMRMIALGKKVSEIAIDLFLSVKTISTYRSRILKKMKMKNNAELTHYAIKHGLVQLE